MCESKNPRNRKYFAAANSYNGFVSLFDKVFKSEDFNRIYLLKGGPGTGKSSLMKKIASHLKDKRCDVDEIYCSSDPKSLDGVIAKNCDKKIAIIDGTAPHERDANIPGAIDEIIDLASGFDLPWLIARKKDILELNEEKKNAYKTAYSYLRIAGSAYNFIADGYKSVFIINEAKIKAEEILSSIPSSNTASHEEYFISSFGRYGRYKIDENETTQGHTIRVYGDEYSSEIFIDIIHQYALLKSLSFDSFLSPFNPSFCEGMYFPDSKTTLIKSDFGEIDLSRFFKNDKLHTERIRRAKEMRKEALEEAERWFAIASDLHFKLEEIYGVAMDFSNNDVIFDKKIKEIENILQI